MREEHLKKLATLVCEEHKVDEAQFLSKYVRGRASRARHIFVLAASDAGYTPAEIESVTNMQNSFVTQVKKRNYRLRTSIEYLHAFGFIHGLTENGKDK